MKVKDLKDMLPLPTKVEDFENAEVVVLGKYGEIIPINVIQYNKEFYMMCEAIGYRKYRNFRKPNRWRWR